MGTISPETLTRLLDTHGAALVLYARQWCRTPEDAVQDVFLLLMRQRTAPDNPVGWLYRAVRNRAITASRSAGRRSRHEAAAAGRDDAWFVATPEAQLDAAAATRALEDLPIEQRETIVARLWGELPFEQVAQLTGCSVSTAFRRYQAGLSALRERLNVACPETKTRSET